ncbi:MAG: YdcF family protein [Janthinobacterium lividum]
MKFKIFNFLFYLGTGWIVSFIVFVVSLPQTLPPISQKTDALVVLTGGSDRLEAALDLMHQNVSEKMLISGVHPQTTLKDILNLDAKKNVSLSHVKIFLDYYAHSTLENAQKTKKWVQDYHVKSIRLVTAHYHMPRALLEFHQNFVHVDILAHPIVPRVFKEYDWFYHKDILWLLWREYHKYLGALARSYIKSVIFNAEERS